MEPYGRSSSTAYVDRGLRARQHRRARQRQERRRALPALPTASSRTSTTSSSGSRSSRGATATSRSTATRTRRSPRCSAPPSSRRTSTPSSSAIRRPIRTATSSGTTASTTRASSASGSPGRPPRRRSASAAQPQALDRAQQQFAIETRLISARRAALPGALGARRRWSGSRSRCTSSPAGRTCTARGDLRLIDGLASKHKLLGDRPAAPTTAPASSARSARPMPRAGRRAAAGAASSTRRRRRARTSAWLDRFVKGVAQRDREEARACATSTSATASGARAPSWRAASKRLTTLYLSAAKSGSAKLSPNDGTLADAVPTGRDSYQDSYVYDPAGGMSVPAGKDGRTGSCPTRRSTRALDEPHGLTFTGPVLDEAAAAGRAVRAALLGDHRGVRHGVRRRGSSTSRPTGRRG